jgi:hypothetical protein
LTIPGVARRREILKKSFELEIEKRIGIENPEEHGAVGSMGGAS